MRDKANNFWSRLLKDKWLLLFCVALAFLSWQGIRKNIGFKVTVSNIAVEVEAPEGWAVWEKSAPDVDIVFRGSREDIRYLNNEQLRVVIPVTDPKYGEEMTIQLSKANLRNPTGATVMEFSPAEIVVRLDKEEEVSLPIKATLNGSLPEGLEIDRIVCVPASARVSGAGRVLEGLNSIPTEPVELSNRQASFKQSARVALPEAGRVLADPEWVSVEIFLEARDSEAVIEKVPVRVMCAPGEQRKITVSPATIQLTVKGKQTRVEQIRSADVFAYVSCYDLTESTTYELPVTVDLPSSVQAVKTEPSIVLVEVGKTN